MIPHPISLPPSPCSKIASLAETLAKTNGGYGPLNCHMRRTNSAFSLSLSLSLSLYSTFLIAAALQSHRGLFFFEGLAKIHHLADAADAAAALLFPVPVRVRWLKCVNRRRLRSNLNIVLASFVFVRRQVLIYSPKQ